ncbi:MAG TPA: GNAT family N-acetyltransferase [Gemmatimonadaceae bacterium]|nr:GNAT family N-acetyltransferase [Gemmatimonadaceae bacterium]
MPRAFTPGRSPDVRADRAALETPRLRLAPWSPAQLLAMRESVERYEADNGLPLADGLREFFVSDDVSPAWVEQLAATAGPDPWTLGFAVIHRDDAQVIGSAGFKGAPGEDGVVEIAYGIVPGYQRKGYATEAARALVAFALERVDVTSIRAHTKPENGPSGRVLANNGFQHVGEVMDPEDGLVWRWERSVG